MKLIFLLDGYQLITAGKLSASSVSFSLTLVKKGFNVIEETQSWIIEVNYVTDIFVDEQTNLDTINYEQNIVPQMPYLH